MDAARELYRREKLRKEGKASASQAVEEATRLRELFLDRLSMLRREMSWRDFEEEVGLPHSTMHSWTRSPKFKPTITDLHTIADRAELPGVPRGRLSIDWLCGLSDAPSRDARVETDQLPAKLAEYVIREGFANAGTEIEPWNRAEIAEAIRGERLLQILVDMAAQQIKATYAEFHEYGRWMFTSLAAAYKREALEKAVGKREAGVILTILGKEGARLLTSREEGSIFSWEPAVKSPPKLKAKRKRAA